MQEKKVSVTICSLHECTYPLTVPPANAQGCTGHNNESVLTLQTLLPSSMLTAWFSSKLEQSEHELQALVTLAHRQVDIGADSAQGVQQRRQ